MKLQDVKPLAEATSKLVNFDEDQYLRNRAKKKAPLKKMKKGKELKEQMMGDPEAYEKEEDLETPPTPKNAVTGNTPSLLITRETKEGRTVKILGGTYNYDKLKRIFSNFYNYVLSDVVSGNVPTLMKYSNSSLLAAVEGKDGEYVIKVTDLSGFDQVKDFNKFLKTGLA